MLDHLFDLGFAPVIRVDKAGDDSAASVDDVSLGQKLRAIVGSSVAGGGVRTGSINGMGLNAIFSDPVGLAIDQDANLLYVADQGHHLIRQIDLEDTSVTTLAGTLDEPDAFDGTGDDASFDAPAQIAFQDGTLYVADVGNHAIRQINISTAEVTTVVGTLGVSGGSGQRVLPLEQARLYFAAGVAVAPDGLFLTADEALMFATP